MKRLLTGFLIAVLLLTGGCGVIHRFQSQDREAEKHSTAYSEVQADSDISGKTEADAQARPDLKPEAATDSSVITEGSEAERTEEEEPDQKEAPYLIVIDPGHQRVQNTGMEPDGPGSSQMKQKVSSGTSGVRTGINEYELNLQVALKLKKELKKRGYDVIMTREKNDVDISNAERAAVANDHKADAFLRIHADGDDDSSLQGMMTICQTPDNPYNGDLYSRSHALAEMVLDKAVKRTGAKRRRIWETDTMSGINWSKVPCTIVEMGFMSNPEEDALMSTEAYQYKIAEGIADGVDAYFTFITKEEQ